MGGGFLMRFLESLMPNMPMTIKEARKAQEQAKLEEQMSDVSFFSGYIAALIDGMPEEEHVINKGTPLEMRTTEYKTDEKVTRKKINDFLEEGGINLRA